MGLDYSRVSPKLRERIKQLHHAQKLNCRQISERLGVSARTVGRIIEGLSKPPEAESEDAPKP